MTVPVITSSVHNQDTDPGQPVTWQVTVSGGQPPYSVKWEWGDGDSSTDKLASPGATSDTHTYQNGGAFNVIVRITDALGHQAALQLVTIVNGPGATAIGNSSGNEPGALLAIWPTLAAAALITISFWLGERHLRAQEPPLHVAGATSG